jgi:hypothetical protein
MHLHLQGNSLRMDMCCCAQGVSELNVPNVNIHLKTQLPARFAPNLTVSIIPRVGISYDPVDDAIKGHDHLRAL